MNFLYTVSPVAAPNIRPQTGIAAASPPSFTGSAPTWRTSNLSTTVTEIRQQLETVRSVLDFCMVYGIQDSLIFSNDYKLVIAFAYARNHLHADLFKDVRLEKIAAFDREHSSFYLDTLRACFECKRDLDDPFQLSSLFFALLVHDHIL